MRYVQGLSCPATDRHFLRLSSTSKRSAHSWPLHFLPLCPDLSTQDTTSYPLAGLLTIRLPPVKYLKRIYATSSSEDYTTSCICSHLFPCACTRLRPVSRRCSSVCSDAEIDYLKGLEKRKEEAGRVSSQSTQCAWVGFLCSLLLCGCIGVPRKIIVL